MVFLGSYRVIYPQPKEQQDIRQHKKTKSEEKTHTDSHNFDF